MELLLLVLDELVKDRHGFVPLCCKSFIVQSIIYSSSDGVIVEISGFLQQYLPPAWTCCYCWNSICLKQIGLVPADCLQSSDGCKRESIICSFSDAVIFEMYVHRCTHPVAILHQVLKPGNSTFKDGYRSKTWYS
jgi:hypothetical protein